MRILFLAGATSVHSQKWIGFFAGQGHQILWISLHGGDEQLVSHPNIRLVIPTAGLVGVVTGFRWLRQLVQEFSPDVTHVHSVGTYGVTGALLGRHPMVMTPWGSDINLNSQNLFKRGLLRWIMTKADMVTADADYILERSRELGRQDTRFERINFGVDTSKFSPNVTKGTVSDLNQMAGFEAFSQQNFNIVSTRNFHAIYNVSCVLRAMPEILAVHPEARLFLAGKGPEEAALRALCEELGLVDAVAFVGHLDQASMPVMLAAMDAYVSTATSDAGIASSTAEAMACGVPVLITDVYENGDWIDGGRAGFLFAEGDASGLAAAVKALAAMNEADRQQMAFCARKKICDENEWMSEMRRMEGLLGQLVA
jgi:glycosyltransferase involved in cell wall biosynthesis